MPGRILAMILALSLASYARADSKVGLSYLGICHDLWPCEQGLAAYRDKKTLYFSFLYDRTFGDDCPCIREMYQDPRDKVTRIHLSNGPGLRNKRLQNEEIFSGFTISTAQQAILRNDVTLRKKFEDVARRAAGDYAKSHGQNKLYVSTCLECNFSEEARRILISWAEPFFPEAIFIDNPLWGACLPDTICEKHGDTPALKAPCIVDLDGEDFQKVDLPAFVQNYSSCLATFIWGFKFNLIDSSKSEFVPPRMRKAAPDQDYFKIIASEMRGF